MYYLMMEDYIVKHTLKEAFENPCLYISNIIVNKANIKEAQSN